MSPRKYDMRKRAAAAEETRRRIVDATLALHAEQGIAATRWDDIAARAGVGVGTVYRHFPTLDELVPACGRQAMERLALPDPSGLEARFDSAEEPRARVERLVEEVFAIYERGAPLIRATLAEPAVHPQVERDAAGIERVIGGLVDAALAPLGADAPARRVTRAMVDLGTWTALREQGLEPRDAVTEVAAMLRRRLDPASPPE